MKRKLSRALADWAFIAGTALLFLGCIATSYRSARTLEPGQVSLGGGYLHAINTEENDDPVQLLNLDFRVSPGRQVDLGMAHTFDLTPDNDNGFATLWGDVKVQLTNTDNELNKLTLATGLLKGYAYHEKAKTHFTSIPLIVSVPLSEQFTPTFMYRHEFISEDFIPTQTEELENPRSFFALGFEYAMKPPSPTESTVKLGASIGTFNSLGGGSDGERGVTFNFGISIDFAASRAQ